MAVTTRARTANLAGLRRLAVARTFFAPTTIEQAVARFGFVQADPIRAPARAQDLTLRHRVEGYRAGDLERCYPTLPVEEDFFVNYGFLPRAVQALMHPRSAMARWSRQQRTRADALLAFVRERGTVHPREVDAYFAHGTVTNYWGGASSATTHLLDGMHYRGLLRIARREGGVRIYAARDQPVEKLDAAARRARVDALIDVVVATYAPLPGPSLSWLVRRLQLAAPQWRSILTPALERARARLSHARVEGSDWYWAAHEATDGEVKDVVRLLAPFDPLVWDRRRFELFWSWRYRFEAYTPAAKRTMGYYALPVLWRDRIVGWANVTSSPATTEAQARHGTPAGSRASRRADLPGGRDLDVNVQYAAGARPRERMFRRALDEEIERMRLFLSPV